MPETVNVQAKKQLAKLLATENITVVHAGTRTATFDPKRRILTLPIWKDMSGDIYDLLVLHETGHALYTPKGSKPLIDACNKIDSKHTGAAKTFINVVEDARIEKLQKKRYPGARGSFVRGYKALVERNFFGTKGKNINEFGIVDRLNIHFKVGHDANIQFSEEEMKFVKAIEDAMTFDEVVNICIDLYAYAKKERADKKKQEEKAQEDLEGDEDPNEKQGQNDKQGTKKVASKVEEQDDEDETIDPDVEPAGLPDEDEDDSNGPPDNSDPDVDVDGDKDEEESGDDKDAAGDSDEAEEAEESEGEPGSAGSEDDGDDEGGEDDHPDTGTETEDGPGTQPEAEPDDSPIESTTDQSWTEQQDELRDKEALPIRYLGLPEPRLSDIVVGYKEVNADIRSFYTIYDLKHKTSLVASHEAEFERFKHENKPVVDWLLKEFEMHKAADQYARTTYASSGELDMRRLHEYKYSDDILRRNAIVPGGKNHGNITFLDFSGSMKEHLLGTVHQLINQAMFQRKAQIIFRVFTFGAMTPGDRFRGQGRANTAAFNHSEDDYAFYAGFTLREVLSSAMTAREFNEACVNLLLLASGASADYMYSTVSAEYAFVQLPPTDQLGGTPLNEAIVCAIPLALEMRKRAQHVNVTFLTDGEATTNGYYCVTDYGTTAPIKYGQEKIYLRDEVNREDYDMDGNNISVTNQFLHILKARTNVTVVGFFISGKNPESAFHNFFPDKELVLKSQVDKLKDQLEKNFFVVSTTTGYDEFYILPSGSKLRIGQTGSVLAGLITNAQMVSAMSNQGQMQRKQRVLLTRYIKLIS